MSFRSGDAVDKADEEVEELDPQVPEGQVFPLTTKLEVILIELMLF